MRLHSNKIFICIGFTLLFILFFNVKYLYKLSYNNTISSSLSGDILADSHNIAFAIPVGGRTDRSENIFNLLDNLYKSEIFNNSNNKIFIFEDNYSRDINSNAAISLKSLIKKFNTLNNRIIHVRTNIRHKINENQYYLHGYNLNKHYFFMFQYIFTIEHYNYIVVLEDDLKLSVDCANYFSLLGTKLLNVDKHSIFCVSAHTDNAFFSTSKDDLNYNSNNANDAFQFRRGEHFMAPGFMIYKDTYFNLILPNWWKNKDDDDIANTVITSSDLIVEMNYNINDDNYLEFIGISTLELTNHHWDRFFDAVLLSASHLSYDYKYSSVMECVYPEVPRIHHGGAVGFTINKRVQLALYENLRLSPTDYNYIHNIENKKLDYLLQDQYEIEMEQFIKSANLLYVIEESIMYSNTHCVYVLNTVKGDADMQWNKLLTDAFGLGGLGGYGGNPKYGKLRGVHKGSTFIRLYGNLILVIGIYSPYFQYISDSYYKLPIIKNINSISRSYVTPSIKQLEYIGCYQDSIQNRLLTKHIPHYTKDNIDPYRCSLSCYYLHYRYSGLQNNFECWCGNTNVLDTNIVNDEEKCTSCASFKCGGPFFNAIYTLNQYNEFSEYIKLFLAQNDKESCDMVCNNNNLFCSELALSQIYHNCELLRLVSHSSCSCTIPRDYSINQKNVGWLYLAPGIYQSSSSLPTDPECFVGIFVYLSCKAVPYDYDLYNYQRLCPCVSKEHLF